MWSVIPACLARSFAEPVSVILSPFCRLTLLFSVKSAAELICVLPLAVFTVTSPAAVNAPFAPTRGYYDVECSGKHYADHCSCADQ